MTRQKESQLRQHSFFQLRVHLKRGKDLIARDKSGKYTVLIHFAYHKINISRYIYQAAGQAGCMSEAAADHEVGLMEGFVDSEG